MSDDRTFMDVTELTLGGCPYEPDPETGDPPCDLDDRGGCRTCGLGGAVHVDFDSRRPLGEPA